MKKIGHYNLIQTDAGWHSTLCAGNNKVILTSVGVHKVEYLWRAEYDIDFLQTNELIIGRRISKDDKHYFCLSKEVGVLHDYWISETYNTKQSMERGIKSVLANAKTTDVRIVDRRTKK